MVFPLLDLQKTQLHACSGGKLTINPATGTDIIGGVVEVVLESAVTDVNSAAVMRLVDPIIMEKFGDLTQWNHLMYVLPMEVDFGTASAFAFLGGYKSVFKGKFASYMGVQIHEFGHNYNLQHSGYGDLSYGDHTGLMGTLSSVNLEKKLMFFLKHALTLDPLYMHCRQPILRRRSTQNVLQRCQKLRNWMVQRQQRSSRLDSYQTVY